MKSFWKMGFTDPGASCIIPMEGMRMARDFRSARYWAAELIETALCPGARAVDATMGNGHDTL